MRLSHLSTTLRGTEGANRNGRLHTPSVTGTLFRKLNGLMLGRGAASYCPIIVTGGVV